MIKKITKKNWKSIQNILNEMSYIITDLANIENDEHKKQKLETVNVDLCKLNLYLGRYYTLEEIIKDLKAKLAAKKETEI